MYSHTIEGFYPTSQQIAVSIIELTKKYAGSKWDEAGEKAFQYLKDSLSLIATLAYPDNSRPYFPHRIGGKNELRRQSTNVSSAAVGKSINQLLLCFIA